MSQQLGSWPLVGCWLTVHDVDAAQRDYTLPLGTEALMVVKDQLDQFRAINQPQVLTSASEVYRVLRVGTEGDKQPERVCCISR
jgi:hypothetical protein